MGTKGADKGAGDGIDHDPEGVTVETGVGAGEGTCTANSAQACTARNTGADQTKDVSAEHVDGKGLEVAWTDVAVQIRQKSRTQQIPVTTKKPTAVSTVLT